METRPHVQATSMQPVVRLITVRWNLRYSMLRKFFHIVMMICLISVREHALLCWCYYLLLCANLSKLGWVESLVIWHHSLRLGRLHRLASQAQLWLKQTLALIYVSRLHVTHHRIGSWASLYHLEKRHRGIWLQLVAGCLLHLLFHLLYRSYASNALRVACPPMMRKLASLSEPHVANIAHVRLWASMSVFVFF